MENVETKEEPQEKPPEGRCWIDQGQLHVTVPLFMPNGEFIAYGMLHKAGQIVDRFFRHIEREAQKDTPRIVLPAGMPRPN